MLTPHAPLAANTLGQFLQGFPGMYYRFTAADEHGRLYCGSASTETLTGYAPGNELLRARQSYEYLIHPDDRAHATRTLQQARDRRQSFVISYRLQTRIGQTIWVEERGWHNPTEDTFDGFILDITERKQTELDTQRREAIFGLIVAAQQARNDNGASIGATIEQLVADLGTTVGVSRCYVFENSTGMDRPIAMSQRFEWVAGGIGVQLDNPELQNIPYHEAGFGRWGTMLAQGKAVYGPIHEFPATEQPLLASQDILSLLVVPIFVSGNWWGFIGFDDCVTERAWTASDVYALQIVADLIGSLLHRQQRLSAIPHDTTNLIQQILDNAPSLIDVRDLQGRFTLINSAYQRFFRAIAEDLVGKDIEATFDPVSAAVVRKHFEAVRRSEQVSIKEEALVINDQRRYFHAIKFPVRDATGTVVGIGGVSTDVTEYRQLSENLQRSEAMLQTVMNTLPQLIYWKRSDGRFMGCNAAFAEHVGLLATELVIGMTDEDLPESLRGTIIPDKQMEQQVIAQNAAHMRLLKKVEPVAGTHQWYEQSLIPLHDPDGAVTGVLIMIEEITERKEVELERQRLQERVIAVQQGAIQELSTPLIPLLDGVIVMPLIGSIDDWRATQMVEMLLQGVTDHRARIAILDITGVQTVDTHVASVFLRAAEGVKLLGAKLIVTGIQPAIAQTMVRLGIDIRAIQTRRSLQDALAGFLRTA